MLIYQLPLLKNKFSKDDVYKDIVSLFIAGMDTTASGIAAALFYLKKNPEVLKKLKKELSLARLDYLSKATLSNEELEQTYEKIQS